jgi:hypothetical protein
MRCCIFFVFVCTNDAVTSKPILKLHLKSARARGACATVSVDSIASLHYVTRMLWAIACQTLEDEKYA